jgi:uncharacterized protein (DUF1800 family)
MAWTEQHVRRLWWRAGFGATEAEARHWAAQGKAKAVGHLLSGGSSKLTGPAPAMPIDPVNEWGHDALWWLDRMVRTGRPLDEKMTLFWADHFACAGQDTPLQLRLNKRLRAQALGSFPRLVHAVTVEPAMLLFLSLAESRREAPNENYARELMELFTLGSGYTERDIREAARAMTGFSARWGDSGFQGTRYRRADHDPGVKRIFGRKGRFDYRDVLRLCVDHPRHAPFLVDKLWSFFVTAPLDARTRKRLVRAYKDKHRIKPVVAQILEHPALYRNLDAPDMVKAPVVYAAGALRSLNRGIDERAWTWLLPQMGQELFSPPSVAGWDWGAAWLSTTTMRTRFLTATYLTRDAVAEKSVSVTLTPEEQLEQALAATGRPWISAATREALLRVARDNAEPPKPWQRQTWADMSQRTLRHFLLSGPDAQVC